MFVTIRIYTPFHEDKGGAGTKAWNAVANALIIISIVLALTVVLVLLYKYRCYKVCRNALKDCHRPEWVFVFKKKGP